MAYLGKHYPAALMERYKIEVAEEDDGYALLMKAGRKRGFVVRGGEIDTERMAKILLDEFRGGKLGRFTLELPEDGEYDTSLTGDITLIASGTEIAAGSRVPVGMIVNTGVYGAIEDEEE